MFRQKGVEALTGKEELGAEPSPWELAEEEDGGRGWYDATSKKGTQIN